MTANLISERAALSCMFLISGCSQTNAVLQVYIPDVDVKQCVNALMSCAALFQLQHLLLTDSLHVSWVKKKKKPLSQPKLHKTINILQTYNCHCSGT